MKSFPSYQPIGRGSLLIIFFFIIYDQAVKNVSACSPMNEAVEGAFLIDNELYITEDPNILSGTIVKQKACADDIESIDVSIDLTTGSVFRKNSTDNPLPLSKRGMNPSDEYSILITEEDRVILMNDKTGTETISFDFPDVQGLHTFFVGNETAYIFLDSGDYILDVALVDLTAMEVSIVKSDAPVHSLFRGVDHFQDESGGIVFFSGPSSLCRGLTVLSFDTKGLSEIQQSSINHPLRNIGSRYIPFNLSRNRFLQTASLNDYFFYSLKYDFSYNTTDFCNDASYIKRPGTFTIIQQSLKRPGEILQEYILNADDIEKIGNTLYEPSFKPSPAPSTSPTAPPSTPPTASPKIFPTTPPSNSPTDTSSPTAPPKNSTTDPPKIPGTIHPIFCFSGDTVVQVEHKGNIAMKDLKLNDRVMIDHNGNFEPVYSFGHHLDSSNTVIKMRKLFPLGLEISDNHMIFVKEKGFIPASMVKIGDELTNNVIVTDIKYVTTTTGIYAPFTPSGVLIVNGVLASNFVAFQNSNKLKIGTVIGLNFHDLAYFFESTHRLWCYHLGSCKTETYTTDGISIWVDKALQLTQVILKEKPKETVTIFGYCFHFLLLTPSVITFVFFASLAEMAFFTYRIATFFMILFAYALNPYHTTSFKIFSVGKKN